MLLPDPGAIYVMDRGYVDFARLHVLHEAGAFFVTRAKSNLDAHRVRVGARIRLGVVWVPCNSRRWRLQDAAVKERAGAGGGTIVG